ncbi:hypothetical protein PG997_009894 [Apiospora hydei]|uniref:Uncharacterized protein n=1 Tax=Apiospora hydei TaxID=1337664 RepID=A0ABR1VXZ9_9PEZI
MLGWYQARLAARPLLTQSITTAVLFATGDITAQQLVDKKGIDGHDFARTGRMALYGGGTRLRPRRDNLVRLPPAQRDGARQPQRHHRGARGLRPAPLRADLHRPLPEQHGRPGGGSPQEKLEKSYKPALQANYMLWPFVQLVNFKFVPLHHRVLFVNVISIGWNCFLSMINSAK